MGEPHFFNEIPDAAIPLPRQNSLKLQGKLDILTRREGREEVEKLEDRAYCFAAQAAEPVLVESAQWLTRDLDRTLVGPVDSADAIEQGALPGP
jgi:hypothetical protein